jgi:hypothetical protein
LIDELGLSLEERSALDRQAERFEKHAGGEYAGSRQSPRSASLEYVRQSQSPAPSEEGGKDRRIDSVNVPPVGRPRGFERIGTDGERYLAHCFKDGLYRMADPALGRTKHHAKNQRPVTFEEIGEYLRKGYLLRMRGDVNKQVNLISPSEIKILY